jgi:hypothetical protein
MIGRTSFKMLYRLGFVATVTLSLTACGTREPATDAERLTRGRELVQQMSARLAAAPSVSVTTSELREVVRASGKKEAVTQTGLYTMRRPDRFYAKMTGPRALEAWYNGKTLTIASHAHKVFAQAPMPETTDRALDALAERYDMPLPMGDLLYGSAEKALLSDTTTGGYVGTEDVGGVRTVHLAFKDKGVDWEVWLPAQGEPLPKRLKVVQTKRTGQPVVDLTFTAWDLAPKLEDAAFAPKVPGEYEGIAILQRAAAVKRAAEAAATDPAAPTDKK